MKRIYKEKIAEFDSKGVVFLENYFSEKWIEKLKIGIENGIILPKNANKTNNGAE